MRKDERAALATLLDSVGLGYTKHQAETKLLRAYLKNRAAIDILTDEFLANADAADDYLAQHAATVGDIVAMMGDVKGVCVLIDQNGVAHVSVMMTRVDTLDATRSRVVSIGNPIERVTNKTAGMTLEVLAAKIAAKSARAHKGRARIEPVSVNAPAKKAKAKR